MSTSKISGSDITLLRSEPRRIHDRKDVSGTNPATGTVELSQSASLLAQAADKAMAAPDMDMGKVETIRQAIANGELKIDTEQLAQKMMEFEDAIFGADTE